MHYQTSLQNTLPDSVGAYMSDKWVAHSLVACAQDQGVVLAGLTL
jgi:hypothetical protein